MYKSVLANAWLGVVLALVFNAGCNGKGAGTDSQAKKNGQTASDHKNDHGHGEEGPHHGQLVELGNGEYHAEMVHDDETGKITLYILDGKAKEAVPTAANEIVINYMAAEEPRQAKLSAAPLEGETGKSSRFEITSKELFDSISEGPKAKAIVNIMIDGKQYSGLLEGLEHHHDHDHDHKHSHK